MPITKGAGVLEKPYVVCHMLTAVDGKIDGDFMLDPACAPYRELFGHLRIFHQCDATLYGTVTMQESYADGIVEKLPTCQRKYPRQDYIAQSDVQNYIVSVDTAGVLAWKGKYMEKKGRPKAHVIEVLTQQVSDDYLAYLRSFDISYIFAGYGELDCQLLLKKLADLFGIRRLMISGGGCMNWTFLQENLMDFRSFLRVKGFVNDAILPSFRPGCILCSPANRSGRDGKSGPQHRIWKGKAICLSSFGGGGWTSVNKQTGEGKSFTCFLRE